MFSIKKPVAMVTIAMTSMLTANTVLANDWPETSETCQRLVGLLTEQDIAKVTGRKGVVVGIATPSRSDECNVDVAIAGSKTKAWSAISFSLRQHLSGGKAAENVMAAIQVAGGMEKATVVADDPRGRAFQLKYGFEFVSAVVDSAELTLNVRDSSLHGPKTKELGQIMFRRALGSQSINKIVAEMQDVAGLFAIGPVVALAKRCMAADMPRRDTAKSVFDATSLATIKPKPVEAMSPYAQRWVASNRISEQSNKQIARINEATRETLADDCEKMETELPDLLKSLDPLIKSLQ